MALKVLVAFASRHGATAELAERMGAVLRGAGLDVDVIPAGEVQALSAYGAVVLGSAVYYGRWLRPAAAFLKRWSAELVKMPFWVFSSGPTGEGDSEGLLGGWRFPENLRTLLDRLRPRDTAVFKGKIDPEDLGFLERTVVRKVRAPVGDFREWEKVESWAASVGRELRASG